MLRWLPDVLRWLPDVLRWPLDVLRWLPDVLRWPLDVLRWPLDVLRWPPDVLRWFPDVLRWPPDVLRWLPDVQSRPTSMQQSTAMPPTLRPETPADIPAIHHLTAEAFQNAEHTSRTEQFIVDALRAAGQLTISLVAEDAGTVIGHVALSPVTLSDGTPGWYGLGPVSVHPGRQRTGIGSRLVRQALDDSRRAGAAGCVVLGDPGYYGRFGFRAEPGLVLPGVPPAYFQALPFGGPVPRARVRYHEGFDTRGPDPAR